MLVQLPNFEEIDLTNILLSQSLQNLCTTVAQKKEFIINSNSPKISIYNENCVLETFEFKDLNKNFLSLNKSFYLSNKDFLKKILIQFIVQKLQKNESYLLYDNLLKAFEISSKIYKIINKKFCVVSGIYLIFNKNTNIGYIGQSYNIIVRFETHVEDLIKNSHHNCNLQNAFNNECNNKKSFNKTLYSLEHFVLLFLEVDILFVEDRLLKEDEYMDSWPGPLYNIKNNKKLK